MHPIIYDVAVSLDGYIAGPNGDVSGFAHTGAVVDDYVARLTHYRCALIGRLSYEVGYAYGLKLGQNPYPHMRSIVVSRSLNLPADSAVELWRGVDADKLNTLRNAQDGPVYLCGGGVLASALLSLGCIDILRLKRAPILLGGGTPLFAETGDVKMALQEEKSYGDGYEYQEFVVG